MTSRDVLSLLKRKHVADLFVPECKSGPTLGTTHVRLDAWVMPRSWQHRRCTGYEIKVSRSDFLGDNKMREYLSLCNSFYVVAPAGVVLDPSELIPEAGLLQVSSGGNRLITKKKASCREIPDPVDLYLYVLISRTRVVNNSFQIDIEPPEFWSRWIESKEINRELGSRVSSAITKRVISEIEELRGTNAKLERRIQDFQKVEEKIVALGLDPQVDAWSLLRQLDQRKNGDIVHTRNCIKTAISSLQEISKMIESGI